MFVTGRCGGHRCGSDVRLSGVIRPGAGPAGALGIAVIFSLQRRSPLAYRPEWLADGNVVSPLSRRHALVDYGTYVANRVVRQKDVPQAGPAARTRRGEGLAVGAERHRSALHRR